MDKEIADQLEIAPKTVENHVRALLTEAGVEMQNQVCGDVSTEFCQFLMHHVYCHRILNEPASQFSTLPS